jgi:hypothetical protein
MARKKRDLEPRAYVEEPAIEFLCQTAGISIPPERRAGAAERLNDMLAFSHELNGLETEESGFSSSFDPSWVDSHGR